MSKLRRTDRIKRPGYPPRPTQHANTADATVSLTRLPEHLCSESGPHKPSSLIHQEPIMSQTRASIPYVTAFTPQENNLVSPNGSRSKLAILQPFGVIKDSERPGGHTHTRQGRTGNRTARERTSGCARTDTGVRRRRSALCTPAAQGVAAPYGAMLTAPEQRCS